MQILLSNLTESFRVIGEMIPYPTSVHVVVPENGSVDIDGMIRQRLGL